MLHNFHTKFPPPAILIGTFYRSPNHSRMLMMTDSHRSLLQNYGTLVARIVIGAFFTIAGIGKIGAGFGLGAGFALDIQNKSR